MKKYLLLVSLLLLMVASCSNDDKDDDDSTKRIKQIEKDIVGIWVVNFSDPYAYNAPYVFYFNKDKTGSVQRIQAITNGQYTLEEDTKMKNYHFEEYPGTYGHVHKLIYEIPDKGNGGELMVHHVSPDSLSIQLLGVPVAFKKVESIDVKQ